MATTPELDSRPRAPWYAEVTGYHWLVLFLASAGWVFDVYEGQIFNITSKQMLRDIVPGVSEATITHDTDVAFSVFLVGGALGGVISGMMADRYGRKPVLVWTIIVYSIFSGLTYAVNAWWQVLVLRFLVAMGVAGAWSVAAALVAEVFPTRIRAYTSSLFHATSILGTWLAALVALYVGAEWRYAYLLGLLPAIVAFLIGFGIREPRAQRDAVAIEGVTAKRGSLKELLTVAPWNGRAISGLLLAAIGLGTFWAITVSGQKIAEEFLKAHGVIDQEAAERAKFAYGIVQASGGGIGLLAMGPLCTFLGRRWAFIVMHLAAYAIVPIVCYLPNTYNQLLLLLPVFGGLTLGIHAGYAVYFPELFPQHLRATGSGFCFNGGRLVAASVLIASGWIKSLPGVNLQLGLVLVSQLFLVGAMIAWFMPETRNADLSR
jgi:MFS family permease